MIPTLYHPGTGGLYALNPMTKLALTAFVLTVAATVRELPLLLATFVILPTFLAAWGRVLKPFLRICARVVWPFALSLVLIQGFFAGGETVLFSLGSLNFTLEGLELAAFYTARLLLGLGMATLLMLVTRPDTMMQALVEHRMPSQIAYIVVTALQIIPEFQARARSILEAQRARGLETEGSVRRRVRGLVPLIGPLILSSLRDLEERAMALEVRGFSRRGRKTSLQRIPDSRLQWMVRWSLVAASLGLVIARVV
jgi:energy-coupling factor transport system permease protein